MLFGTFSVAFGRVVALARPDLVKEARRESV